MYVYVDYVYNYLSLKILLEFVKNEYLDGCVIVVLGSLGNKVIFCWYDFGKVLLEIVDVVFLMVDDLVFEDL